MNRDVVPFHVISCPVIPSFKSYHITVRLYLYTTCDDMSGHVKASPMYNVMSLSSIEDIWNGFEILSII